MISNKARKLIDDAIGWSQCTDVGTRKYDENGNCVDGWSYAEEARYYLEAYISELETANANLERQLHEIRDGIDPLDSNPGRDVPALALAVSLIEGQDGFTYPHEYFAVVALTVDDELQPVWINTIDGSLVNVLRWWHLPEEVTE